MSECDNLVQKVVGRGELIPVFESSSDDYDDLNYQLAVCH